MLIMEEIKKTATENLIKLAIGMEVTDEIVEIKSVKNEQGEYVEVEKKVRMTKRTLPPDLTAITALLAGKLSIEKDEPQKEQVEFPFHLLPNAVLKKVIAYFDEQKKKGEK